MALLAQIELTPGGVIAWVAVGLVVGLVAGRAVRGGGYGTIVDVGMGLAGALVGGLLSDQFAGQTESGGSLLGAVLGACLLIWAARAVGLGRSPAALSAPDHRPL